MASSITDQKGFDSKKTVEIFEEIQNLLITKRCVVSALDIANKDFGDEVQMNFAYLMDAEPDHAEQLSKLAFKMDDNWGDWLSEIISVLKSPRIDNKGNSENPWTSFTLWRQKPNDNFVGIEFYTDWYDDKEILTKSVTYVIIFVMKHLEWSYERENIFLEPSLTSVYPEYTTYGNDKTEYEADIISQAIEYFMWVDENLTLHDIRFLFHCEKIMREKNSRFIRNKEITSRYSYADTEIRNYLNKWNNLLGHRVFNISEINDTIGGINIELSYRGCLIFHDIYGDDYEYLTGYRHPSRKIQLDVFDKIRDEQN